MHLLLLKGSFSERVRGTTTLFAQEITSRTKTKFLVGIKRKKEAENEDLDPQIR